MAFECAGNDLNMSLQSTSADLRQGRFANVLFLNFECPLWNVLASCEPCPCLYTAKLQGLQKLFNLDHLPLVFEVSAAALFPVLKIPEAVDLCMQALSFMINIPAAF